MSLVICHHSPHYNSTHPRYLDNFEEGISTKVFATDFFTKGISVDDPKLIAPYLCNQVRSPNESVNDSRQVR